ANRRADRHQSPKAGAGALMETAVVVPRGDVASVVRARDAGGGARKLMAGRFGAARRVSLLALLLVLGAAGCSAGDSPQNWGAGGNLDALWRDVRYLAIGVWSRWTQPEIETADLAPVRYSGVSPYGINTFLHLE